jgi:hypothetical protein
MTFADSYAFLDDWVLQALRSLGVDAVYQPLNDIASPAGKIGGAAQKRLANGGVLHHATLSYDMDGQVMTEVLRIGREKLSDKGTVSAAKRVDPLRSQTGCPRGDHRAIRADVLHALRRRARSYHRGGIRRGRGPRRGEVLHRRVAAPRSVTDASASGAVDLPAPSRSTTATTSRSRMLCRMPRSP